MSDALSQLMQEKEDLDAQIESLQLIVVQYRRSATKRFLGQTGLVLLQMVCYACFAALLALLFIAHKTAPFSTLFVLYNNPPSQDIVPIGSLNLLVIAGYLTLFFACILSLLLGITIGKVRHKTAVIDQTAATLKKLLDSSIARRDRLQTFSIISASPANNVFEFPIKKPGVNDVMNPGFDEDD